MLQYFDIFVRPTGCAIRTVRERKNVGQKKRLPLNRVIPFYTLLQYEIPANKTNRVQKLGYNPLIRPTKTH